ncbi:hypothetical protein [Halotia branconii]|uniref:Uncharacterized protein n=1 Tax=Halotia branconii CENA392 TaxID=1539056 RepID=A0AAJ6P8R7_9CYAN|nr:hypothetical protein [Halotia branconii]WGV25064.1 hypothetical protein QI031_25430 [Halotia branconii CENA392]
MTSREDEIKKLIADIDNLLTSSGKRLPRLLSNQTPEPKEVLERVRNFLVQIEENDRLNKSTEQPLRSPLLAKFVDQSSTGQNQPDQEQNNFISQQLKNEFSALIQPLQAELTAMLQERATLVQEIRQLEQKRLHHYSLSQQWENQEQMISEFLQVLMTRLIPNLTPQLAENLVNSASSLQTNYQDENIELTPPTTTPFLESSDQTERLTQLARDLDQRLLSLDGTVNVVFDALQRNINTYHESLSQSLARMHSTGVQGEQLMEIFLNNLTQYLQPQSATSLGKENKPLPSLNTIASETIQSDYTNAEIESQPLEFIEPEIESQPLEFIEPEAVSAIDPEAEDIDAMLLELGVDEAKPLGLQSDNATLMGDADEVDQLYASLFGNSSFNKPSVEVNPETTDLSPSDIADTTPTVPSNQESPSSIPDTAPTSPEDSTSGLPDPWLDKSDPSFLEQSQTNLPETLNDATQSIDLSLESWQALFFDEDTDLAKPTDLSISLEEEVLDADSIQPRRIDTITTLSDLSDLFADIEEQLPTETPIEQTVTQNLEVVINEDEQQEEFLDNYIPASPQENLLSPEINQPANVQDISLDEQQLQQLHQDLANFDEQLNPAMNVWDSAESWVEDSNQPQQTTENTPDVAFPHAEVQKITPISLPQTEADLDFSPTVEKKNEVTNSESDQSIVANSNSPNNSEIAIGVLDSVWYLGIDLGTTGISAALLNRSSCVVYPIYWSAENQVGTTSFQQSFRLPAEVYLPTASVPHGETESAQDQVAENLTSSESAIAPQKNLYSAQLKPYLQIAIPYKSRQQRWEPVLQFNEFSAGPLIWVVRSLSKLLLTLKSDRHSTTQGLTATAVGFNAPTFHSIISNIAGIICTCPSNWSEQYRFNVREALLTSKLVQHPQQVFFIEEAIASLLGALDGENGETVQLSDRQGLRPAKTSDHPQVGNTLAINIGASATEMALVDLPENLLPLAHQDFMLHGFAYASKGIEQDIICQLLVPPKYRQSRFTSQGNDKTMSNPWQWQTAFPGIDQMYWQSLGLEELDLPRVGEPDIDARIRLQQRLESSLLGQAVLDAALALKLILQHQESFTLELADQRWIFQRRDLESQVFIPFVRRLNRELNKLLVARGIPTEAINQAILTGGVASLGVVNSWLRQKLPNAKIIQDLYLGDNGAPNCSRVAYGLAMLPLHPQVLEESRQQYTDYFLFTELLRLLPDRTLSFGEVLQLFEGRGINTSICQQRLLAFLEGELPPGLIPASSDTTWLTQKSHENSDYQAIAAAPLFEKQGNLTYRPNLLQMLALHRYLNAIKASIQQSLEEPYTVNFASVTH